VGHVWLSPGSNVELIEVSTRRPLTEQVIETSLETTRKEETSTTTEDEISDAIKQDNRQDTKLGFSTTVNQSWGSGNATATATATATGTLDLGRTQDTAREQTHKRMRQQTEKLSTEIRQNFKSTFRTTTETVDTSSKRYLLNNTIKDLINYELRRKMRSWRTGSAKFMPSTSCSNVTPSIRRPAPASRAIRNSGNCSKPGRARNPIG
jgi:hypothetical protein